MECSSKEMSGVDEIFEQAINTVVMNDRDSQQQQSQSVPSPTGQQPTGIKKRKKRDCRFL